MAAPAPVPPPVENAPAAKRQRLATTEVAAWTPPVVTHTWTIEDLTVASITDAASTDTWLGPVFEAGGLRWRLVVKPNREETQNRESAFGIYLWLLDRTSAPVELAEVTVCISDGPGFHIRGRFYAGATGEHQSCTSFRGASLSHTQLARAAKSLLPGGQMVLSVTPRSRSFADLAVPTPLAPALPALIAKTLPALGSELADGVDVVFRAAAAERIGAHSYILALHSKTLRASLWGPLAVKGGPQPRELDIPEGIDTATFKRVLAFMYTDAVAKLETPDFPLSEIQALLHAADYLDVPRLREICAAELHKRLAPDTAVATLKLAHSLSCAPLLDATLRYIAAKAPAVMRAPGWAALMLEPGLMQAVLSTIATGEPPAKVAEPPAPQA